MGQIFSRQLLTPNTNVPTNGYISGSTNYTLTNTTTGDAIVVQEPLVVPKGASGDQVYDIRITPITEPFQLLAFGTAKDDEYVSSVIKGSYDCTIIPFREILDYTYVYYISGVSTLYPENSPLVGQPVIPNENTTITCPTSNSECLTAVDPKVVVTLECELVYNVDITCNDCTKYLCLDFSKCAKKMFIYITNKIRDFFRDVPDLILFQQRMWAYLIIINRPDIFIGFNPFVCGSLDTQLTYPYMIYANVMMTQAYYAIEPVWSSVLNNAISFVTVYGRMLWSNGTDQNDFEYDYLQDIYLSMCNRVRLENLKYSRKYT